MPASRCLKRKADSRWSCRDSETGWNNLSKADAALDWLSHNSAELPDGATPHFIVEAEKARERFGPERVPAHFGRSKAFATKVRWLLSASR